MINRHIRAYVWRFVDQQLVQLYSCAVCMGVLVCLPLWAWAMAH